MLYLVPTPIGNLEDITLRAIRILTEVDLILAEDTRVTRKLLSHLDISQPLQSFHIHNEHRAVSKIIDQLKEGKNIALVTDAGMPGISDPGFLLVRSVVREGLEFTVLPGPNAITPALVMSGFPTNEFYFGGFMPTKKGRQKKLTQLQERTETIVLYESPHRIGKLAKELSTFFPNRWVSLVREISKLHEEVWRGLSNDFPAHIETHAPRGEMVVVISPVDYEP